MTNAWPNAGACARHDARADAGADATTAAACAQKLEQIRAERAPVLGWCVDKSVAPVLQLDGIRKPQRPTARSGTTPQI